MEENGFTDDEAGYTKVIEILLLKTKSTKDLDHQLDEDQQ